MSQKTTDVPTNSKETFRRDFLKVTAATGIGACAVCAPVCAGFRLVTAPAFAESAVGKFYDIAPLDSLTEQPQRFPIIDDRRDAWMTVPEQRIGTIYLRKVGDEVQALHALCPHAGCMVQIINQSGENVFSCPCHVAFFDLNGVRRDATRNASPRDMDTLEVRVEDGRVFVRFENFAFGVADKRTT